MVKSDNLSQNIREHVNKCPACQNTVYFKNKVEHFHKEHPEFQFDRQGAVFHCLKCGRPVESLYVLVKKHRNCVAPTARIPEPPNPEINILNFSKDLIHLLSELASARADVALCREMAKKNADLAAKYAAKLADLQALLARKD